MKVAQLAVEKQKRAEEGRGNEELEAERCRTVETETLVSKTKKIGGTVKHVLQKMPNILKRWRMHCREQTAFGIIRESLIFIQSVNIKYLS